MATGELGDSSQVGAPEIWLVDVTNVEEGMELPAPDILCI